MPCHGDLIDHGLGNDFKTLCLAGQNVGALIDLGAIEDLGYIAIGDILDQEAPRKCEIQLRLRDFVSGPCIDVRRIVEKPFADPKGVGEQRVGHDVFSDLGTCGAF